MGVFSKCCAKTHLPVIYGYGQTTKTAPRLCRVVVLTPHEPPFEAVYDGYGLGLVDEWDEVKFVLKDAYAGEAYGQLPASEDEPNQGFFFREEFLTQLSRVPSLPSFDAYFELLRQVDDIDEEVVSQCLHEAGLTGQAPSHEMVHVLECAQDVLANPELGLVSERYAQARAKRPVLEAMFPADPQACKTLVQTFFPQLSQRLEQRFRDLLAPFCQDPSALSSPGSQPD